MTSSDYLLRTRALHPWVDLESLPFGISSGRIYRLNETTTFCAVLGKERGENASLTEALDLWYKLRRVAGRSSNVGLFDPTIARLVESGGLRAIHTMPSEPISEKPPTIHMLDLAHPDSTQLQAKTGDSFKGDNHVWLLRYDRRYTLLLPHQSMDQSVRKCDRVFVRPLCIKQSVGRKRTKRMTYPDKHF